MDERGTPLELTGDARRRGLAQATCSDGTITSVRAAIEGRLREGAGLLATPEVQRYLQLVRAYTEQVAPRSLAEMEGIAEGFGLAPDALFAYLHLAIVVDRDVARAPGAASDGCSAWTAAGPDGAAWVGKNRDFRGEHQGIQRVFLHQDPDWGGRRVLCVGSLGAPGAYSSGMNSDGLALADTQITTWDHGIGLGRYFLMTEVLARCATVPEAIDFMHGIAHAGGGSLLLGDAQGGRAAVELGHRRISVEQSAGDAPVSRTNHFTGDALRDANLTRPGEPMIGTSPARLATLEGALAALPRADMPAWTRATMASHDDATRTGLCRHGQDGDATTISTALYATGDLTLHFCDDNPCRGTWRRITL